MNSCLNLDRIIPSSYYSLAVDIDTATNIVFNGITLLLLLSAPSVGIGLVVGFMISLFQALTQIQEQTLTFVPKLVVVMLVLALTMPWMASQMMQYCFTLWSGIPALTR